MVWVELDQHTVLLFENEFDISIQLRLEPVICHERVNLVQCFIVLTVTIIDLILRLVLSRLLLFALIQLLEFKEFIDDVDSV